jgi:hypothetical protein
MKSFKSHLKNIQETRWKFGPQAWDMDDPPIPTPPTAPTTPSTPLVPAFDNGYGPFVNEPFPPGSSPTRPNQPINIPPAPPSGLPRADPRLSDTNSPMEIRPPGPRELLPGIFDTGTLGKPNGNSPPRVWFPRTNPDTGITTWHLAVLQCNVGTGQCIYADQSDDPMMIRDNPPDGYIIWNPEPPPGRFELYNEPEFDWWPFW